MTPDREILTFAVPAVMTPLERRWMTEIVYGWRLVDAAYRAEAETSVLRLNFDGPGWDEVDYADRIRAILAAGEFAGWATVDIACASFIAVRARRSRIDDQRRSVGVGCRLAEITREASDCLPPGEYRVKANFDFEEFVHAVTSLLSACEIDGASMPVLLLQALAGHRELSRRAIAETRRRERGEVN